MTKSVDEQFFSSESEKQNKKVVRRKIRQCVQECKGIMYFCVMACIVLIIFNLAELY